jgi:hypothetical protein
MENGEGKMTGVKRAVSRPQSFSITHFQFSRREWSGGFPLIIFEIKRNPEDGCQSGKRAVSGLSRQGKG